ncbi:MAG: DUF6152 family protein [Pseudomonadales bacterium]|nr:DUF6152 family protein [Pseudomonadales bacterium]
MKNRALSAAVVLLLLLLSSLSAAVFAHHSFAMFDQSRKVSIKGVVTDVQWTNPHVWIEVDVPDADGENVRWAIEFTSRVHLTRRGFTRTTVNVGDEVTFVLSPYQDGRPGGRFWTVTLPTGEIIRDPGAQREYEQAQAAAQ